MTNQRNLVNLPADQKELLIMVVFTGQMTYSTGNLLKRQYLDYLSMHHQNDKLLPAARKKVNLMDGARCCFYKKVVDKKEVLGSSKS